MGGLTSWHILVRVETIILWKFTANLLWLRHARQTVEACFGSPTVANDRNHKAEFLTIVMDSQSEFPPCRSVPRLRIYDLTAGSGHFFRSSTTAGLLRYNSYGLWMEVTSEDLMHMRARISPCGVVLRRSHQYASPRKLSDA